jgi:hypothetical protein
VCVSPLLREKANKQSLGRVVCVCGCASPLLQESANNQSLGRVAGVCGSVCVGVCVCYPFYKREKQSLGIVVGLFLSSALYWR